MLSQSVIFYFTIIMANYVQISNIFSESYYIKVVSIRDTERAAESRTVILEETVRVVEIAEAETDKIDILIKAKKKKRKMLEVE